ncbi:MAG: DALR domain-containing protein, partial [Bacteroidales bacterium]
GNFITLDELFTGNHKILEQAYSPMTVRFFILQAHYRSTLDFSNEALQAAEKGLKRMLQAAKDVKSLKITAGVNVEEIKTLKENVYSALCDDLNTPIALSYLFDTVKIVNQVKDGKMLIGGEDKLMLEALFTNIVNGVLGIIDDQGVAEGTSLNTKVLDGVINM